MRVSIIIPVYKVEKEITRCLLSVFQQDYNDIEIVLVNDRTPDDSFKIARDFVIQNGKDDQVLFIEHQINQGLSQARNSGIKNSSGDYLFFLDSDDVLSSSDVISHLISYAENDPELDLVMGNYQKFDDQGIFEVAHESRRLFMNNEAVYKAYSKRELWITAWGKLIRKSFLIDHELFFKPGIYHEDELWSFRLFRIVNKLYVTPRIVYDYYSRQGSIMSEFREKNLDDLIIILKEMSRIFYEKNSYHRKETIILIESYRREVLKKVFYFTDESFQLEKIKEIKKIKLPLVLKKRPIKQNLLLRFPALWIREYLKRKF